MIIILYFLKLCCSRKYPYSPYRGFFWFEPPLPSVNSSLVVNTPSPLGFSVTLLGEDMDISGTTYFLRLSWLVIAQHGDPHNSYGDNSVVQHAKM